MYPPPPLPPTFEVLERVTSSITGLLVAEDGATPIPGSTLTTLTATLYVDNAAQDIINSRNNQDILGVNGGSVDEFGILTLTLGPDDNPIVDDALQVERHVLLLQWTWALGAKSGKAQVIITVRNLAKVP